MGLRHWLKNKNKNALFVSCTTVSFSIFKVAPVNAKIEDWIMKRDKQMES